MKLTKVIALLCALFTLFAFVGCSDSPNGPAGNQIQNQNQNQNQNNQNSEKARLSIYAAKGDPVLPSGTLKDMPTWDVAPEGKQGLPPFITKLNGNTKTNTKTTSITNVTPELKAALKEAQETPNFFADKPKNVIFIISDGMGEPQVKMSREYKGELICDSINIHRGVDHRSFKNGDSDSALADKTSLTTTDSCAGGTAMLSGYKTRYGYIGLDRDGKEIETLGELAKRLGKKVGNVTNDCAHDATPADTICHSSVRDSGDCLYIQQALFGPDVEIGGYTSIESYAKAGTDFLANVAGKKDSKKAWNMAKEGVVTATVEEWWNQYKAGNILAEKCFGKADFFADKDAAWYTEYFAGLNYKFATTMSGMLSATPQQRPVMNVNQAAPGDLTENYEMGFLLKNSSYPSFPEMVAYTIAQLYAQDKADDNTDGFFCMIENTTTDGWGHYDTNAIKNSKSPAADGGDKIVGENIKAAFIANEVQNTDEGVAIAIKFVLEHPDTLLVVSADHDTGGLMFDKGWEEDYELVTSSTSGHSSAMVPLWAVGAGADIFTKDLNGNEIADITTEEIMSTNIINDPSKTDYINYYTGAKIGELMGDPNFGCRQDGDPRYGGYSDIPKK